MPAETIRVRVVWVGDAGASGSRPVGEAVMSRVDAEDGGTPGGRDDDGAHGLIVHQHVVEVPAGATIAQALAALVTPAPADAARLRARVADGRLAIALFGRPATGATVLREDDRIELVGPLRADPKQARQHRVQRQREAGGDARWRRRADPGSAG